MRGRPHSAFEIEWVRSSPVVVVVPGPFFFGSSSAYLIGLVPASFTRFEGRPSVQISAVLAAHQHNGSEWDADGYEEALDGAHVPQYCLWS